MSSPSSFPGAKAADRPKVPRTRAATWSHRETLDFLALWGEDGIQAQLNRCHRNADVYQWISERMAEKGYCRDEDQCRTKGKDLKKSYKQAKLQDGLARQRCRFFHELDAILGGGGGGRAAPWCQVVIKEESDPELDPERGLPEDDCAWARVSATDGSDVEPQGEPSAGAAAGAAACSSSSSSSSQAPGGLLQPEDGAAPILLQRHAAAAGGFVKEERSPAEEEAGAAEPYLYAQEDARGESPRGDRRLRPPRVEEPLLRRETRAHLDAPWRPAMSRRAFPRPRTLLSTREKLAQLRSRRKRPRDDKFDELLRDIRTHFREREKLFQGLWEEEKAQREKDRRLWTAEMGWIRQMWAKGQRQKEAAGEEPEKPGSRLIKEERWDLCKDLEGAPPEDTRVREPPLLKVACAADGNPFSGSTRVPSSNPSLPSTDSLSLLGNLSSVRMSFTESDHWSVSRSVLLSTGSGSSGSQAEKGLSQYWQPAIFRRRCRGGGGGHPWRLLLAEHMTFH